MGLGLSATDKKKMLKSTEKQTHALLVLVFLADMMTVSILVNHVYACVINMKKKYFLTHLLSSPGDTTFPS